MLFLLFQGLWVKIGYNFICIIFLSWEMYPIELLICREPRRTCQSPFLIWPQGLVSVPSLKPAAWGPPCGGWYVTGSTRSRSGPGRAGSKPAGQLAGAASPADTQLSFRSPSWGASYSAHPHRCNFISCPLHCKPLWVCLLSNAFSSFKLRPATNYSLKFLNLGLLPSEGASCRVCLSPPPPTRNWGKWLPEGRVVLLNHCFTDWVFSFSILISTSACIQLCFKGNLSTQLIP